MGIIIPELDRGFPLIITTPIHTSTHSITSSYIHPNGPEVQPHSFVSVAQNSCFGSPSSRSAARPGMLSNTARAPRLWRSENLADVSFLHPQPDSSSKLVEIVVAGAATSVLVCALALVLWIGLPRRSSKHTKGDWKRRIKFWVASESAERRGTMSIIGEDKYKIAQEQVEARQPRWKEHHDGDMASVTARKHSGRQTSTTTTNTGLAQPAVAHCEDDITTPRNWKTSHSTERRISGSVPDRVKEEDVVANLRISDTPALMTTLRRHSEADVLARGLKRRISRGVAGSGVANKGGGWQW
jgi:hypothetical protein